MIISCTHFNYYLVCHRKLWLFASVRYVFKPVETDNIVPTALINQGMAMFYHYNVPDGTWMA